MFLPCTSQLLIVYSMASLGAQNGAKILPIGFKNTLSLTLTSVNFLLPPLYHSTE